MLILTAELLLGTWELERIPRGTNTSLPTRSPLRNRTLPKYFSIKKTSIRTVESYKGGGANNSSNVVNSICLSSKIKSDFKFFYLFKLE